MCTALVSAGYQVTATDKRAEAEEAAVACGATWRDTPAQAAIAAGVLITMLPGPREVQAAMLGEAGALKGLAAGATWIDMTSNSPADPQVSSIAHLITGADQGRTHRQAHPAHAGKSNLRHVPPLPSQTAQNHR